MVERVHKLFSAASSYDELLSLTDIEWYAQEAGFSYEALLSILSQKMLTLTRISIRRHRRHNVAQKYADRVFGGESLRSLAAAVSLPPTMLARIVLESYCGVKKGRGAGQLLKEPWLIAEEWLRREIAAAVEEDPHHGPYVDTAKRLMGHEFEELLAQKL